MINVAAVRTFEDLYLQIAKLKPQDQNHIMMCLRNRQRTLQKEMERRNNSPVVGAPFHPYSEGQAIPTL